MGWQNATQTQPNPTQPMGTRPISEHCLQVSYLSIALSSALYPYITT